MTRLRSACRVCVLACCVVGVFVAIAAVAVVESMRGER